MQQACKVLASSPARDMFSLFLAPAGGRGHGKGSTGQPRQDNTSHTASFGRGRESHMLVGSENLLDQSPQLTEPQALVMAEEQDVANPPTPSTGAFPAVCKTQPQMVSQQ